MTDRFADQPGALDERDIVGDAGAPAGMRAADAINLYLRMRLEEDPAPGNVVKPLSWGMEFDLDGNLSTYEVMVVASGVAGSAGAVTVYRNIATALPNDPNDPADLPAVATYPFAMNARTLTAPGSTYGNSPDFFVDFAVPWSALTPLGLDRNTATYVWAATSSAASNLDGDVACHDGAGGPATLSGTVSDPTTGDPAQDPVGPGGTARLEGGGGCSTGGAGSPLATLGALALFARLAVRRRRTQR
jgi:MYXO-CTERM domain-containing protein